MRSTHYGPAFGVPLSVLVEQDGSEVPKLFSDLVRWLAAPEVLAEPDVFQGRSRSPDINKLKAQIQASSGSYIDIFRELNPVVVGSLLKRWLEELPDPLLTWDLQVEFLSACKDQSDIEVRIAALNDATSLVDTITLGTLKPLLLFLQQYCFRQRRFDQQLLQVAVAFAPILFPAALAAGPEELRLAEESVATLVSNALHIFNPSLALGVPVVTPQALCEAAAEAEAGQQVRDQGQQGQGQQLPAMGGGAGEPARCFVRRSVSTGLGSSPRSPRAGVEDVAPWSPAVDAASGAAFVRPTTPRQRSGAMGGSLGGDAFAWHHHADHHHQTLSVSASTPHITQYQQQHHDMACDVAAAHDGGHDVMELCEPYMHDAAFWAALDGLVEGCVVEALFADLDEEPEWRAADADGCADEHHHLHAIPEHLLASNSSAVSSACGRSSGGDSNSSHSSNPCSSAGGGGSSGGGCVCPACSNAACILLPSTTSWPCPADGSSGNTGYHCSAGSLLHSTDAMDVDEGALGHGHGHDTHGYCQLPTSPTQAAAAPEARGRMLVGGDLAADHEHDQEQELAPAGGPGKCEAVGPARQQGAAQGKGAQQPHHHVEPMELQLAQDDVAEGSVVCIIKASSWGAAAGKEAALAGGGADHTAGGALAAAAAAASAALKGIQVGKAAPEAASLPTQLQALGVQQQEPHSRRSEGGGAPLPGAQARAAVQPHHGAGVGAHGVGRALSRLAQASDAGADAPQGGDEQRPRQLPHMSMGGHGGAPPAAADSTGGGDGHGPHHHHHQAPYSVRLLAPGSSALVQRRQSIGGSGGGAPAGVRPVSSGGAAAGLSTGRRGSGGGTEGGAGSGDGDGATHAAIASSVVTIPSRRRGASSDTGSSGGGHSPNVPAQLHTNPLPQHQLASAQHEPAHRTPQQQHPAHQPSAHLLSHMPVLGIAGHLRVRLCPDSGRLVTEQLNTPAAAAHQQPLKKLGSGELLREKEILKRQLKDVSHAFRTHSGHDLTPALKEPLRAVYVRYHRIKGVLTSGEAAASPPATPSTPLVQQQLVGDLLVGRAARNSSGGGAAGGGMGPARQQLASPPQALVS